MNLFHEAKSILDKDGKVNPLGPYGRQKLTGREVSTYFRRNPVKDAQIKKAVEVALDLQGAMTVASKEIKKFYGDKILRSKEVQKAFVPTQKDEISLYISKKWYSLIAIEEYVNRKHCVEKLDPAILSNNILAPILGITDARNDKRLSFIDGTHSLKEIQQKVDSGEFKAAFLLKPISINQIKEVADQGESMPPKSTYIKPKLRSGMLIYDFED